ncbi:hypothetical protein [Flavobacterium sp.]|uniref:hypothetical protein n=1 Tax=Flavobacterium sp. TaxID=239 RepID=UPI0025BA578F|nr:hypothetical protein [Flavobacterium sp.]
MKKLKLIIGILFFMVSCSTSMTPVEVNNTLPKLTKSKFISKTNLDETKCKYLVKGRNYVAPIGFSVKDDLKYGAQGIDEWVKLDGGNSYILTNYKWVTVDQNGSTQLHLEFDTLKCEE